MKYALALILLLCSSLVGASEPLPQAMAFQASAKLRDPNTLTIQWHLAAGYQLYRDRLHFKSLTPEKLALGQLNLPPGKVIQGTKNTPSEMVYTQQQQLIVPILGLAPGASKIAMEYQGCSVSGFCYPPSRIVLHVQINTDLDAVAVSRVPEKIRQSNARSATIFHSRSLGLILISFFGFGLLLAFTPCVLPMLPVLSAIILGQNTSRSSRRAALLALAYVLSLATTYALIGFGIAYLGKNIQTALQTPTMILFSSVVFFGLGLSLFDRLQIQFPARVQTWINQHAQQQTGGTYFGVIGMGILATLILSPCVTGPLVAALGYIAQTGDLVTGSLALFSLGFGMGTPLLIVATAGQHYLPRTGPWMVWVKHGLGLILMGIAISLVTRLVPPIIATGLWSCFLITTATLMGVFTFPPRTWREKVYKAVSILFLTSGIGLIVSAPNLQNRLGNRLCLEQPQRHTTVKQLHVLRQYLATPHTKPTLIAFYADWCRSCHIMAQRMSQSQAFKTMMADWRLIRVDVTRRDQASAALEKAFSVIAPPTFLFMDRNGTEIQGLRITGETSMENLLGHLKQAAQQGD